MIQAPMAGGWTTPELVSAVCGAGGFGVLAGARITPEKLREEIRAVKARTNKPFGVNFLLAPPEEGNRDTASVQRTLGRFRERLGLPPGETGFAPPPSQSWRNRSRWCSRSAWRCSPPPWATPASSSSGLTGRA
jgi:nitronate monooxygenase